MVSFYEALALLAGLFRSQFFVRGQRRGGTEATAENRTCDKGGMQGRGGSKTYDLEGVG